MINPQVDTLISQPSLNDSNCKVIHIIQSKLVRYDPKNWSVKDPNSSGLEWTLGQTQSAKLAIVHFMFKKLNHRLHYHHPTF